MRFFLIIYFLAITVFCFCQNNKAGSSDLKNGNSIQTPLSKENLKVITKIDSLLTSLHNSKEDSLTVIGLNSLANEYLLSGNYGEATAYADKAIILAEKIKYKKGLVLAYTILGNSNYRQGNYSEAFRNDFISLRIAEEVKDKKGIAKCLNNIGSLYSQTGNYPEALKKFEALLMLSNEIKYFQGIALAYENTGIIYETKGEYDKALSNYFEALKIREEARDTRGVGWAYQNIGMLYGNLNKFEESQQYLSKSLDISMSLKDKAEESRAYGNIAQLFQKQKKYDKAIQYCEKGLTTAKEAKFHDVIKEIEKVLYEIYESKGDAENALIHFKRYVTAKDTTENKEVTKKIVQAEMNYKFENQRAKEVLIQERKEALAAQELSHQKKLSIAGMIGVLLITLLGIVLFLGYKRKSETNSLLALQQEEIKRQKAGIAGQEQERLRISKELHDGLGGSLAGIKLNLERISSLEKDHFKEIEKIIDRVSDACKDVRAISHNLSPLSISTSVLSEVLQDLSAKFSAPGLNVHVECFPEEEVNKISQEARNEIYRIIQECLNNIVKHADADKVHIGVLKEENYLYLSIEDNGVGFDTTSTKKGIGLKNIKTRVDLLKGEITIDSKVNRGTAINIKFRI